MLNWLSRAAALAFALAAHAAHAQAPWVPTRPVEMLVGVSAGGGIDRTARMIQKIMQDGRLVPTPVNVVNKPGGGSTIVQAYLNQHAGDAHYYEITATSLLTNHIIGKTPNSHRDFTPVVMLCDEYLGFAVPADSAIRDGRQLLEALRTRPDQVAIGIATSAGNTNHIAAAIVAKAAGADVRKLKIVVFGSGGESLTALLGGHVQLVVTPSANLIPHLQSGRLRAIAVSSAKRLPGALAVAPTWQELGVNAVVANWRPVIGARGWTPQQIAYWERVFAEVTSTEDWRRELERTGAVPHFMKSHELGAYFDSQYATFRATLAELGLAK